MEQPKSAIGKYLEERARCRTVLLKIESYSVRLGRPEAYTLGLNGRLDVAQNFEIVHEHGTTPAQDLTAKVFLIANDAPGVLAEKVIGFVDFLDGQVIPGLSRIKETPCFQVQIALPTQTIAGIERLLPEYTSHTFAFEVDGLEQRNGSTLWDSGNELFVNTASFTVSSEHKAHKCGEPLLEQLAQDVASLKAQLTQGSVKVRLF